MPVPDDVYVIVILSFLLFITSLVYNWAVNLTTGERDPLASKTLGQFLRALVITCLLVGLIVVSVVLLFFPVKSNLY